MNTKLIRSFLTLFAFTCSLTLQAADKDQKIKELEGRVSMLEDYKSTVQVAFDAKSENLKKYLDDEIKKEIVKVEEAKTTLDLILWVGLPTTLLTFVGGWFTFVWYTKKLVINKVADIVEKERDNIIRIVETEAFDNKLRNNKELLVISANEEVQNKTLAFLKKLKFKKVKGRIIGEFDELPEHDLMIFNTPDNTITQAIIDGLMDKYEDEDTIFVAYTGQNLARNDRMNFSNSSYTLYHNILSALKYAEIARLVDDSEG